MALVEHAQLLLVERDSLREVPKALAYLIEAEAEVFQAAEVLKLSCGVRSTALHLSKRDQKSTILIKEPLLNLIEIESNLFDV